MKASVVVLLTVASLVAGCATTEEVSEEDRTLPFACDSVVLIGRLRNGDYQHVEMKDDILGHGWIAATLRVRQVVKGPKLPSVIPVRYFAHTYMRDDRDFMFVISQAEDRSYVIETGQLMSHRPRLAARCSETHP